MAISVQGPDGSTVDFPDDTDPGTITSVMQQNFGGPSGSPSTSSGDSEANKGYVESGLDALRYGAHQMGAGLSSTAKVVGFPKVAAGIDAVTPDAAPGYTPASEGLFDKAKTWRERLGFLPRFLGEQVPQVAGFVGADALTGGVGGPLLAGATTLGPGVQEAAQAAGGDPNNPSTSDYVRGGANAIAQGALMKFGVGKAAGAVGSTADTLAAKAAGIASAAGTGVLAGAGSNLADQSIIQGKLPFTSNPIDWDQAATGALAGGVGAGALRGIGELASAPSQINQAYKFSDFGPEMAPLADRFDGKDTSTPAKSFQAMKSVEADLKQESKTPGVIADQIKDIKEQDPAQADDLTQKLNKIRAQLKLGNVLDTEKQSDLQNIKDTLGTSDFTNSLDDYNNLNRMKLIGKYSTSQKTFGDGVLANPTVNAMTNPLNRHTLGLEGLGVGGAATGMALAHMNPLGALAIPAAQLGARVGLGALDRFMGNGNPLAQFTKRFGSGDVASVPLGPVDTSSVDQLLHSQQQEPTTMVPQAQLRGVNGVVNNASGVATPSPLSMLSKVNLKTGSRGEQTSIPTGDSLGTDTPISGDTISASKDGHTVTADATQVDNAKQWAAAVRKRIGVRSEAIEEAKQAVGNDPKALGQLEQLKSDLTAQHLPDQASAHAMIEKHVQRMAHHHQARVRKAVHTHRLYSTYRP